MRQGKYYFLSSPRRFGKTLLLTTLKAFFEGRDELFRGLYIHGQAKEWKKYPVQYNGYSWDGETTLYNPFSVLKSLKEKDFGNYWFSTSTPAFLIGTA